MAQHPFEEGIREMFTHAAGMEDPELLVGQTPQFMWVRIHNMKFREGVSLLKFINAVLEMSGYTDCDLEDFQYEQGPAFYPSSSALEFTFR